MSLTDRESSAGLLQDGVCLLLLIPVLGWARDGKTVGNWIHELEGAAAVINLFGKSVNCRYTTKNKKEIIDSRVNSTLAIGEGIRQLSKPPAIWINAGSAAIFGNGGHEIKNETSSPGTGFSSEVCKQWEKAF